MRYLALLLASMILGWWLWRGPYSNVVDACAHAPAQLSVCLDRIANMSTLNLGLGLLWLSLTMAVIVGPFRTQQLSRTQQPNKHQRDLEALLREWGY